MIGSIIILSVFLVFSAFGACATVVGLYRFIRELLGL